MKIYALNSHWLEADWLPTLALMSLQRVLSETGGALTSVLPGPCFRAIYSEFSSSRAIVCEVLHTHEHTLVKFSYPSWFLTISCITQKLLDGF